MNVGSIVQSLADKVEPFAEQVGMLMGVIGGIGALLYVGSKVWKNMANGEPLEFYPLLRPFVIGFFVVNFSMVKAPIDFLMERVERLSYGYFEGKFGSIEEQAKKVREKVEEQARERQAKEKAEREERLRDKNMLGQAVEYLKEGAEYMGKNLLSGFSSIAGLISTIVSAVLYCLVYVFKVLITWYYEYVSILYRCILGILGPIAFTVAIFPGFQNGITNWLAKYISICLWPVVFGIVHYLIVSIQTELICSVDYSQWWSAGVALSVAEWQAVFLGIIEIALYLTVPTIVSWIIPNGDTSGALGGMKTMLSSVATAVGAAVGFATGAAGVTASKQMMSKVMNVMNKMKKGVN
jgi:conjugative transposon TraJ protein